MSNIIEITDFAAPELDVYARLTENQLINRHEPEKGIFIAESPKVIERALDAGCVPVSILAERKYVEAEAKKIESEKEIEKGIEKQVIERCADIPVYTAEFDVLTQLTGFQLTRGMLCAMYRPKLPAVEEVCKNARRVAVLEDVVNPTNVGAIFRSAAALNMDAVLLTPACSNPLYRRAIRVSMGTVFQIPWTFLDEASSRIEPEDRTETEPENGKGNGIKENGIKDRTDIGRLRDLGFKTAAMALCDASVDIDDPQLMAEEKLAIVLGTEGDGLAVNTIYDCDYTVCIPMSHGVDSLNVAAASAVAFWQLGKRK